MNKPTEPNSDGGGLNNESVQRMIDDAVKPLQEGQEAAGQKISSLTDNMGSLQGQVDNLAERSRFATADVSYSLFVICI